MKKAIAIVAHHDDHVLWMGGTIKRLIESGWQWTLIAMCVPDSAKSQYFKDNWSKIGVTPISMDFEDYQTGNAFSKNNRDKMKSCLLNAIKGQKFDLVFTHSRNKSGEYWALHTNHVEARELTRDLVMNNELGNGIYHLAYFAYDVIYGGGTAACAIPEADYHLPLTYPELLFKCELCNLAPDVKSSLKNLAFPCPNPEGFEGDQLYLPQPFIRRR